jgi:hypothetical protein
MLVRFSSIKTESITMFGDNALPLIKMLGASGAVPGAVAAEDLPAAIRRLHDQLQSHAAADTDAPVDKDREREPPISLATRAVPLLSLLERASAANAPVMWEKM